MSSLQRKKCSFLLFDLIYDILNIGDTMKKYYYGFLILLLFSYTNVFAAEYLPIDYQTSSYEQANGKSVTCQYALIPGIYHPRLGVANDYSKEYISNLTASLEYDQMETPLHFAARKGATLVTNLGQMDYRQPLVIDGIQMTNKEINSNYDAVYMTKNGTIKTMNLCETTYAALMAENPDWADYVFYKIVENNELVDVSSRSSYAYISLRHPRTFIGQTSTGDYIIGVCDGRNDNITSNVDDNGNVTAESEYGLKLNEIYDFVKKKITTDVKILVNADGGGSSSFVYKGERKNRIIGDAERPRFTFLYWTVENYTVKFNANDGTGTMENQTLKTGFSSQLTTNAFRKNTYVFKGWNTKADGSGKSYEDHASVTDLTYRDHTITLYAQWEKSNVSKLTLVENGKTEYEVGTTSIDLSEILLKLEYENGDFEEITAQELGATTSGFDSSKVGENTVQISFGGKTISTTIEIVKEGTLPDPTPSQEDSNNNQNQNIISPNTGAFSNKKLLFVGVLLSLIGMGIIFKELSKDQKKMGNEKS